MRKLVAEGRRQSKQERLKTKTKPQLKELKAEHVETDTDFEELKRLKLKVEQLLSAAKPRERSKVW